MAQGVHSVKGEIHNVLAVVKRTAILSSQSHAHRDNEEAKAALHEISRFSWTHRCEDHSLWLSCLSNLSFDGGRLVGDVVLTFGAASLVLSLQNLRDEMSSVQDLAAVDTAAYLQPFLDVISSQYTDIYATGAFVRDHHGLHLFPSHPHPSSWHTF